MTDEKPSHLDEVIEEVATVCRLDELKQGPEYAKLWFDLGIRWSEDSPSFLTMPRKSYADLSLKAQSSREAFELAKYVAATRLRAEQSLPAEFGALIADWVQGDLVEPGPKPGPPPSKTWARDFAIRHVVDLLWDRYELRRTRNMAN